MKNNTILYALAALVVAVAAYFLFFNKKGEPAKTTDPAPAPPQQSGTTPCFAVPSTFPPFSQAIIPAGTDQFLGLSGPQFTDALQARIIGFFAALDVNPTLERLQYFGKQAVLDYLQTPSGKLPHWDVVKASLRCSTQTSFVYNL
jgi:hypothetical protein